MIVRDAGDRALLVEYDDLAESMAYFRTLQATKINDVIDVIPAARTILLRHNGNHDRVLTWIRTAPVSEADAAPTEPPIVVPVIYDGEDLETVGEATGMTAEEVVAAHTDQIWTVAFGGFAPGFGYLIGTDDRLHVSRRPTPRTTVPAGAVGLAGEFSGVYPRSSPGGWQLIGRTDTALWDLERNPPALLRPGATVKFERA